MRKKGMFCSKGHTFFSEREPYYRDIYLASNHILRYNTKGKVYKPTCQIKETKMYQGSYKIAGHSIKIVSLYEEVQLQCREYVFEGLPEFMVEICPEDIAWEKEKSAEDDRKAGRPIRRFSDSYLETLAVYRKIAERLLTYRIVLFHGSVVAVDGKGYLFTAKSGTGKSTHVRLWMEQFKERAVIINDDKPLLEITEEGVVVYGTPWDGKHRLSTNTCVPLKAICVVNRGEENYVTVADKKSVYPRLLQQIYRPSDGKLMGETLKLLGQLSKSVELYELYCNMEPEAARVAYEGMNKR